MRDFADTLDDRLRSLSSYAEPVSRLSLVPPLSERASAPLPGRTRRRSGWRLPVITGGMTATIGAAATAIVLAGPGAALPILETETSDASALRSNATLAGADVDFTRGHPFITPDGSGWVFATRTGAKVCLSLPDRATPGEGGAACAPRAVVERDGLALELVGDLSVNPRAKDKVAYVLPARASQVTLSTAGRTVPLQTQAGVAVAWLAGPGVISFRKDGRIHRRSFEGPFPAGAELICGDGRVITPKVQDPPPVNLC